MGKVTYEGTFVLRGTETLQVTPTAQPVIDLTVDTDDEQGHVRIETPERVLTARPCQLHQVSFRRTMKSTPAQLTKKSPKLLDSMLVCIFCLVALKYVLYFCLVVLLYLVWLILLCYFSSLYVHDGF